MENQDITKNNGFPSFSSTRGHAQCQEPMPRAEFIAHAFRASAASSASKSAVASNLARTRLTGVSPLQRVPVAGRCHQTAPPALQNPAVGTVPAVWSVSWPEAASSWSSKNKTAAAVAHQRRGGAQLSAWQHRSRHNCTHCTPNTAGDVRHRSPLRNPTPLGIL